MIFVEIALDSNNRLCSFSASGHAGMGIKGTDTVCASVTILLRTTLAVLEEAIPSCTAYTAGEGSLCVELPAIQDRDTSILQFAADFLVKGISSLQSEYPKAVKMNIKIL